MSTTIESLELEIKSNSTKATSGIDALTQSLTKLKKATSGAAGLKSVSQEVKTIGNSFKQASAKAKEFAKAMKQASDSNNKGTGSFTDIYFKLKSFANVITSVGKKVYSSVKKSMDYTENMNLFTVAMGEYAGEAMGYAEQVSEVLGIDTSEWIRAQGVFMTLATGFGVAGDRAKVMSQNLTQLGYDLASFYNLDTETAMLKLKSGLAGELEPLRDIGYDLSQAKLEATAMELGITKSVSAMTQAEKAQLRYYAIMTQVTVAQGDMARTLDDPANQMRVFKAQISMASREIGNVFIPMLNKMLPPLTAVVKVVGELASIIAGLFGYKENPIEETTNTVAENTGAMTENLEEAQEEAKKLKSYMLGIDELNVIDPSTSSVTEDTSGWVDFELPDYSEKFLSGAAESKLNDIVGKMKEWLGVTEEITSWSDLLSTNFGNIAVSVGLIAIGLAAWKISTLVADVPKLMAMLSGVSVMLRAMGATAVIAAAIVGAKWLIDNTDDTMTKIGAIVSGAALAVGAILAFTGINLPLGIALMAVGAVSMGSAIAMNTKKLSNEVKGVIAAITTEVSLGLLAIGAILAFSGVNIPLGIALMAGGAVTMVTAVFPNWNTLSESVKNTISIIMAVIGGALIVLGAVLAFSGVGLPLGIGLMAIGAASLGTAIALNWNAVVDGLKTVFASILAIISGALVVIGLILCLSGVSIGLGLALIFAGMAGSFSAWKLDDNPITNFVKKMANSIISIANWLVEQINELFHFEFGGLSIKGVEVIPAFNFRLINIPKIPLMAEGGFPEQGQMFIAREAGAEMVGSIGRRTAVANNDQIVSGIAGGVAEANEEQNALLREQNSLLRAILDKDGGVYLDGKHLANSVEKYQRERGRVLITGGVV